MEFAIGPLSTLVLELLKWIWRKFVIKDMTYDFSTNFYTVAIPVLNVLLIPFAAWLVPEQYSMPTDLVAFVRLIVLTAINSLFSVIAYNAGVKPTKTALRGR